MEEAAQGFIGEHGWVFLVGIVAIVFNSLISSTAQGVMLWWSKQYQADDIIYIAGREARIVRIGMSETVIYYADTSTKVTIPNENIKGMGIEKKLEPMNFPKK